MVEKVLRRYSDDPSGASANESVAAAQCALLDAGVDEVLAALYARRGVRDSNELDLSLARLLAFDGLYGIEQAVDLLLQARTKHWSILVIGDFDADGATATAVALLGLQSLGFNKLDYLVPNRFEFGYGLSPEIVEVAAARKPDLIITVDNGVSSVEGVDAARSCGIEVLVTDHHLPGETLPLASAMVNPNLVECEFPSKNLAGVGVIFYVLLALRARLRELEPSGAGRANLAELLDLVALGTVADVVPLDFNNRILVEQGLRRIRAGHTQPGIAALLQSAQRDQRHAVASDLAFGVGPRLNAAGRMDDMSVGIACLLERDPTHARELALSLDGINRQRRATEAQMTAEAGVQVETTLRRLGKLPMGVCLYEPGWHEGVVGIVASRVKERLNRPTVAFAQTPSGMLKGSARSVAGLHLRDTLEAIATRNPTMLHRYGGHAAAAGLSLQPTELEAFSAAFDLEVAQRLSADELNGEVQSDGELEVAQIGLSLAQSLRAAGPWGQAFAEPLFDGLFEVLRSRWVGERHAKLELRPVAANGAHAAPMLDAIRFNALDEELPERGTVLRIAYRLDINRYKGKESAQLLVECWWHEPSARASTSDGANTVDVAAVVAN